MLEGIFRGFFGRFAVFGVEADPELRGHLDRFEVETGLDGEKETIAYCRIGERSSHTWFVLQELLGHKNVKNYDGSWTEYGSLVGAPIELGS